MTIPKNDHKKPAAWDHLETAHQWWKAIVQQGDIVIDATCGNGQDTLILAQLALTPHSGKVIALDIQKDAIEQTQHRLQEKLSVDLYKRVQFHHRCHSRIPTEIAASSVKLIVYNLGYLPGGNKSKTTIVETTLASLTQTQQLIMPSGMISITCYPGHAEGKREEDALLQYAALMSAKDWICHYQRQINRPLSPSLLLLQRV